MSIADHADAKITEKRDVKTTDQNKLSFWSTPIDTFASIKLHPKHYADIELSFKNGQG